MTSTAPLEIQVYASFPRAVVAGPDLNVNPSNYALQFSQRPYKWICYTIGGVVGAEGDLSTSPDSPDVVNYNAGLPTKSTILYYHTSDMEW